MKFSDMSRSFQINLYGTIYDCTIRQSKYHGNGTPAIQLVTTDGEDLCTVSVNMPDSGFLPPDTFFVKDWSENSTIIPQLVELGIIHRRNDIAGCQSGFVTAFAYELVP